MNDGKKRASASPRSGAVWLIVLNLVAIFWIRDEILDLVGPDQAGNGEAQLRVVALSPDEREDADDVDRLTFVFNREVVTDKEIDKPLGWQPFSIEPQPKPAGQWTWVQPAVLQYKLVNRLDPSNRFEVTAGKDFVRWLGMPLRGSRVFSCSTSHLKAEDCALHSQNHRETKINLRFNHAVDPDALHDALRCEQKDSDEALDWENHTSYQGKSFRISINTPRSRAIDLFLDKGFAGAHGPLGLLKKFHKKIWLAPAFSATDARAPYWRGTESRISVDLRFNRELDAAQAIPQVRLDPQVDDLSVSVHQNAIKLTGSFDRGTGSYEAIVQGDVRAQDGEVLPAGASYAFKVPKRRPTVSFTHSKGFLSPHGNLSLDLKTAAVGNLAVSAQKVYRNNLASQLRGFWGFPHQDVARKEIPIKREGSEVVQAALDLRALIEKPSGVYRLRAEATDSRWTSDTAFVTVTDLGLTTKRSAGSVFAWVTSLSQASPVSDALVSVLSNRNQLIAQGKTDAHGIIELDAPDDHPDGQPWLVTVEKDDDLSYRLLNQRKWHLPDVAQNGRAPADAYDLYLYTERGVFRPGDTIRLTGVLRDLEGSAPPKFPLEVRAWQPDGRKVRTWQVDLLDGGLFHAEFETSSDGQTGPYRFAVGLPGANTHFAEITTLVEAFEPVRVEAKAEPHKPLFGPGEDHLAILSSRYLFGQPAAHLPYVVRGGYFRVPYKSKKYPRHRFTLLDGKSSRSTRPLENATDGEGRAEILLDESRIRDLPGLWEGRFHATVTVPGGRSVSDRFTFRADPLGSHLGLAFPENFPPPPDEPFELSLVMVDGEDKPMASNDTEVILQRIDRNWVLQEVDGSRVWRRQENYTPVVRQELGGSPAARPLRKVELSCPSAGSYRVIARDLANGARAEATFYVSAYENEADPSLASPHRVTLKLEKEKYLAGETAKVRVAAPFAGRLLLTLETDRPLEQRVLLMDNEEMVVDLPIPDEVRGSAFLSASVIRPLDFDSPDWKPHRAYGLARLPIDHSAQRLAVSIEAPAKVEPESKVTLRVNASGELAPGQSGYVHLWAVDEGILLVTDQKTPNPADHFFAPRRNLVDSGDLYLELLPDHKRPSSMDRIGAGGGLATAPLVKPQPRQPAVLWSTFAEVLPDGSYEATFTTPDFTGELRFMAVMVAGDAYGSAEHPLTVASPLQVEPSWPRFVAPGDRFRVPVKVFNSTDAACSPILSYNIEGPVSVKWEKRAKVTIKPGESKTLWLLGEATGLGNVKATISAATPDLQVASKANFMSRPAAALLVENEWREIEAGDETVIGIPDFIIGDTAKTTLTVSAHPSLDLRPAIDRLMAYPHGCLEQSSSRLAPMLFAADLFDGTKSEYLRRMVDAGIRRLASMQTPSGGLAYWPGDTQPYLWGTCYASLLMIEAKRAGHELRDLDQKALAKYLARSLRQDNPGLNQQAFLCRVLAALGKPQMSRQSYLLERVDKLDLGGRAHLAAAWLASGRRDKATMSLPKDIHSQELPARTTGKRLTSPVAQDGILLSVLLSLNPKHSLVQPLVVRLDRSRRAGFWRSTLDDGVAISALCRHQANVQREPGVFTGTLSSKGTQLQSFSSEKSTDFEFQGKAPIRLVSDGHGPVYLSVKTEGLGLAERTREKDNSIIVRRRWLDGEGNVLRDWTTDDQAARMAPVKIKVGDLVKVEVRLLAHGHGIIRNVAVIDSLPGGMEVENPRLATSPSFRRDGFATPDRVEFLDDRVVLFASAKHKSETFAYSMRAITQGMFSVPPVQATCMYDSEIHSMHGAGNLHVSPIR